MELFRASRQWAERPNDERFWNVAEMLEATKTYREKAKTARLPRALLGVAPDEGGEVVLRGPNGGVAGLTHYAFGQVCARVGAPASYLRELPAPLAAECINEGAKGLDRNGSDFSLLLHENGGLLARAVLTEQYERIWNCEVAEWLTRLPETWRVPPARPATLDSRARPATEADVIDFGSSGGGISVRVGDMIAPAGVYASDHDLFVFMVDPAKRIADGTDEGLSRGFFIENSEVGDRSLRVTFFLLRHVCGNHIVWGASNVKELSLRHVGDIRRDGMRRIAATVKQYAESSASDEQAKIERAKTVLIGGTKEEVVERLFGKRLLTKTQAENAYEIALENEDLDPKSVWGMVNGLTRWSQKIPYADERAKIDRAAGKMMEIAF